MKLNDREKEKLKKDIQHPDSERQKREFMDQEQKKEKKPDNDKNDEEPIEGLKPRKDDLSKKTKND